MVTEVPPEINKIPHYKSTMQSYHDFVTKYNSDKPIPDQIRNGKKHTGEHIYRIWLMNYQDKRTEDYTFVTSLASLATRMAKSERTILRHIDVLLEAKVISNKKVTQKGLFFIQVNSEIVFFMDLKTKKVINNSANLS